MTNSQSSKVPRQVPLLVILGGLLILAMALFFLLNRPSTAGGVPKLVADQPEINFGDVKLGQPVQASFTLTNTGSGTLRFSQEPYIEVRAGC